AARGEGGDHAELPGCGGRRDQPPDSSDRTVYRIDSAVSESLRDVAGSAFEDDGEALAHPSCTSVGSRRVSTAVTLASPSVPRRRKVAWNHVTRKDSAPGMRGSGRPPRGSKKNRERCRAYVRSPHERV